MGLTLSVVKGGQHLTVRAGVGTLIGLGTFVVVTRLIGPESYGVYAGALGICTFLGAIGQLGINVYLIRDQVGSDQTDDHQAFTLLCAIGVLIALSGVLGRGLLQDYVQVESFGLAYIAMIASTPIALTTLVPVARLERDMRYAEIARIDLVGQAIGLGLSTALAVAGFGAWALVLGRASNQVYALLAYCSATRYRPRVRFDWSRAKVILGYGLAFSASGWIVQLRSLVNPLIVGRIAGAEGMAMVALATRLLEMATFARLIAWRLSLVAFSKLRGEKERVVRAIGRGMQAQVLLVGLPILALTACPTAVLVAALGPKWVTVVPLIPFIGAMYVINTAYTAHASALHAFDFNRDAALVNASHAIVFGLVAALLIPGIGVLGYGWAELCAAPVYIAFHWMVERRFGSRPSKMGLLWVIALCAGMFWREIGWYSLIALIVPIVIPASRQSARRLATDVLRGLRTQEHQSPR